MNKYTTMLAALLVGLSFSAGADITSDLNNYVDSIGDAAVTAGTAPQVIEQNGYKYATGGRMMVRMPVQQKQIATFKAPNYRISGCGAIDMFGGSMSFMSAGQLITTLQTIGSSGIPSFAFMLAMRTISSQITDTLQEVFKVMREVNNLSLDTCKAAATAVNSIAAGKLTSSSENNCIDQKIQNTNMDYTDAVLACTGNDATKHAALDNDKAREEAFEAGNLAWILMDKSGIASSDHQLRMALMSLTGTIIKKKIMRNPTTGLDFIDEANEDAEQKLEYIESVLLNPPTSSGATKGLLDALINGGSTAIYKCNGQILTRFGCKELTYQTVTFDATGNTATTSDDALLARTSRILRSVFSKIRTRAALTRDEEQWIAKSTLPIYKLLAAGAALKGMSGDRMVQEAAQPMAFEMLYQYFNGVLDRVKNATFDSSYGDVTDKYREGLEKVDTIFRNKLAIYKTRLNGSVTMAKKISFYEKLAISSMPIGVRSSLTASTAYGGM